MSRPACLRAWALTEGSVLPGGSKIVSVLRDPITYFVTVTTTEGARWTVPGDVRVLILDRPEGFGGFGLRRRSHFLY